MRIQAARGYPQLPLAFEPNLGETDAGVSFFARGSATVFFAARGAVFSFRGRAVRMELAGARREARLRASEPLPGKVNEFIGRDPSRWHANVPTFARLREEDVYPGVDLDYHGRQGSLEYDFALSPGADPGVISLRFRGVARPRLDEKGDLLLGLPDGDLRQSRPRAFQDGRPVPARFVIRAGGIGFALGPYDHSRPLLIDPSLVYSTFLGGSLRDYGRGIAVDGSGNAYVVGYTSSADFPTTANALQPSNAGGALTVDSFVSKLNAAGSALVYSTYLGGGNSDFAYGMALDSSGDVYLTGWTDSFNFPTTPGAFQAGDPGGTDAFVTKLNPSGSALVYSSYLGGSGAGTPADYDEGTAIAIDASGNAYVTGRTFSPDFPTQGPFQAAHTGPANTADAFVTKLNSAGSALAYSTYLGGSNTDWGQGIAVDSSGSAYLTGNTSSTDFPTQSPFHTPGDGQDAFVTKLNPTGSGLVYSSYVGVGPTPGGDFGWAIALDSAGSAYVAGEAPGPVGPGVGDHQDAFVAKVNPTGSGLAYGRLIGGDSGTGQDEAYGIAVDSAGRAYVTGETTEDNMNFPTTANAVQAVYGGAADAFVSVLDAAGAQLTYSSYLGGSARDDGYAIAVDSSRNVYVTGYTESTGFPTLRPLQASNGGAGALPSPRVVIPGDAFITKVSAGAPTAVTVQSFTAVRSARTVKLRWRTASHALLLGFNVWREQGSTRVRLNRKLIPAVRTTYSVRDQLRGGRHARYLLEAIHPDGTRAWYGPVVPT